MQPEILIIQSSSGELCGVERAALAASVPYAVLDLSLVVTGEQGVSFSVSTSATGALRLRDLRTGERASSEKLRGIWTEDLRVPPTPPDPSRPSAVQQMQRIGREELLQLLYAIPGGLKKQCVTLPQRLVVNRLSSPFYQVRIARRSGFSILPTYVGRHVPLIREMLGTPPGTLHFTPLSSYTFSVEGAEYLCTARCVDERAMFALANIDAPAIFRRWPDYQVRYFIGMVGRQRWAATVSLIDDGRDAHVTDLFYHMANDNLRCQLVELPDRVAHCVDQFAALSGLEYGTFDILVDGEQIWFSSVHPQGSLELLALAGAPVYPGIIDRLRSGPAHAR